MKITIAFLPEEEKQMRIIRAFLTSYLSGSKTRTNWKQTPYLHTYITTKKPERAEEPGASS